MWGLVSLAIIGLGLLFSQWWMILGGLVILVLSGIKTKPRPAPSGGSKKRIRHKLVQAPMDAWLTDDEDAAFAMATINPPIPMGLDMMYPVTDQMAKVGVNPLATGVLRQILPFPQYGESSLMQRILSGLVVPIDSVLYPKTYQAKFKEGLRIPSPNFLAGAEKAAESAIRAKHEKAKKELEEEKKKLAEYKKKKKKED